jgi:hypothetical protein
MFEIMRYREMSGILINESQIGFLEIMPKTRTSFSQKEFEKRKKLILFLLN